MLPETLGGLAVAAGLLGLCVGSFLNVVIYRLPKMMEQEWQAQCADLRGETPSTATVGSAEPTTISLARPRSRCPSCGHGVRWYENIPLLSWLALRGRCSACKTFIGWRYPLVELATAVLFAACGWKFGAMPQTLLWCAAVAMMVAMALIDLDTTYLPDDLTLPLIGLGLLGAGLGWTGTTLEAAAWGALAGYGALWLLAFSYKKLRGVDGMGEGDFKLLAGLGALLGWQLLPSIVLLASGVGAVVGIGLIVFGGHKREIPIPFGPYLVGGGIAAIFFGQTLTQLWFPTL